MMPVQPVGGRAAQRMDNRDGQSLQVAVADTGVGIFDAMIVLDFGGMDIVTQSYLHALLFSALRLAWARQSFIYVVNASSSVRSGIELVEDYALGG